MVFKRPTSFKRTDTRATHPGQENYSPPKGRIHLRRLVFSTKLFPCSRAADHTFVTVSNTPASMRVLLVVKTQELLTRFHAHSDQSKDWVQNGVRLPNLVWCCRLRNGLKDQAGRRSHHTSSY